MVCLVRLVPGQSSRYVIGQYDTLYSDILHENRRILVHIPGNATDTAIHYPVLYLLDGENHFVKTMGILDQLSNTMGNEQCPQMIVVAIFHPDRHRDLTPPASSGNPADAAGDLFPQFLEKELIPYIDRHYSTGPFRVFAGHSLGGLRVINTLIYNPRLFNAYLALDPSLGHVQNWIEHASTALRNSTLAGRSLYLAMAQTMPAGMDTALIQQDTTGASRHMRCIMRFAHQLEREKPQAFDFAWKYYPQEAHGTVPFMGTYDGFCMLFRWYKHETLYDILKPAVGTDAALRIMEDHFAELTRRMGYRQLPLEERLSDFVNYLMYKGLKEKALAFAALNVRNYPNSVRAKEHMEAVWWGIKKDLANLVGSLEPEALYRFCKEDAAKENPEYNLSEEAVNGLGYQLLQENKWKDAETVLRLNTELYPEAYNTWDSYGECLLLLGRTTEALAAYQKSLDLNPNNSHAANILQQHGKASGDH